MLVPNALHKFYKLPFSKHDEHIKKMDFGVVDIVFECCVFIVITPATIYVPLFKFL